VEFVKRDARNENYVGGYEHKDERCSMCRRRRTGGAPRGKSQESKISGGPATETNENRKGNKDKHRCDILTQHSTNQGGSLKVQLVTSKNASTVR